LKALILFHGELFANYAFCFVSPSAGASGVVSSAARSFLQALGLSYRSRFFYSRSFQLLRFQQQQTVSSTAEFSGFTYRLNW